MEIEHFFNVQVKNDGGDDHKEKRLMCYECESHLRHYRIKQDALRGQHE